MYPARPLRSKNLMSGAPPIAPKKFLTNQGENTLSKRLEKILPLMQDFDCLVGYFFISGFFRLYPALETIKKVRILIGLKNEQVVHGLVQIAKDGEGEGAPSVAEIKSIFAAMMRKELVQAEDKLAIETGVRKFIEWIRSGKLEVKLYREQNIHAKVYIMTPEHPLESVNHGYVVTGSSNFSHSGLEGNLEFNVLLAEPEEHDYALHRFNELWEHAVDVKDVHEAIINTVEKESPFAFFTPYELYLKFLAEYFRDYLGDRTRLNAENLPQNFKKLSYQEDPCGRREPSSLGHSHQLRHPVEPEPHDAARRACEPRRHEVQNHLHLQLLPDRRRQRPDRPHRVRQVEDRRVHLSAR